MIKRLLLVEDDVATRELLRRALVNGNYDVTAVGDAPDALLAVERHGLPHLMIIDLGLPSMHGFDLSKKIKKLGDVPIVFLTGIADEEMIITGLTEYAEDYMVKPVSPRELMVRIRRILSRIGDQGYANGQVIAVDNHVTIDFVHSRLLIEGDPVELTPTEARLLSILVNNAGRVVPADQLLERVWPGEEVYEETLRVHTSRLRRKLSRGERRADYIQNERGLGYRFIFPEPGG
jgi:DNA-binding response OmpR family regulator